MSKIDRPAAGGSYRREKDRSLKRVAGTADVPAPVAARTADAKGSDTKVVETGKVDTPAAQTAPGKKGG